MERAKDGILVVEITTAGGMGSGKARLEAISIEGLVMLQALVGDAAAGGFEVHAVLQEGIGIPDGMVPTDGVRWHRLGAGTSLKEAIEGIAPLVGHCFVVAPEFGGYLVEYTALLESHGLVLLSQPSRAAAASSDKKGAAELLSKAGLDVPATQTLEGFLAAPAIPYPVVVKPNRGAGCVGVFTARDEAELEDAVVVNEGLSFGRDSLIVQELVEGKPLSASVIAMRQGVAVLGINEQDVSLAPAGASGSKYRGGVAGPLRPELAAWCERVARAAAGAFQLDGYFGFDFVLGTRGTPVVVEVNPRLTTSFAGLKMIHPESLLRFMARRKRGEPASLPWIPRRDFAAYRVVSSSGHSGPLPGDWELPPGHQVTWLGAPGGGVNAFIACKGLSRAAAVGTIERLVARLQRDEDQQVDEDGDVMRG
ncbi:MAG: ATP-grasp domain-containing protein [Candidatus Lokiarchaeota archaeon]|nr:ATP-grasp domain-containing protein [Candidatus Lokiarchaeota archaeon]